LEQAAMAADPIGIQQGIERLDAYLRNIVL
jgi:hypothetical protein